MGTAMTDAAPTPKSLELANAEYRIQELERDLAAAEARIAELEKDAARYRWLRERWGAFVGSPHSERFLASLDAAVDSALAETGHD